MNDLKKYLAPTVSYSKVLAALVVVICLAMAVMFTGFIISDGAPLFMAAIPAGPFLLGAAFGAFVLYKGFQNFPKWWNSLSEAQREEIVQDFSNAEPLDSYIMLGKKYAYLREVADVIPYEEIEDVYFRHSRNGWTMFIAMSNGKKLAKSLSVLANKDAVWAELLSRSGKNVNIL